MIDYKRYEDKDFMRTHKTIKKFIESKDLTEEMQYVYGSNGCEEPTKYIVHTIGWKYYGNEAVIVVHGDIKFSQLKIKKDQVDFLYTDSFKGYDFIYDRYGQKMKLSLNKEPDDFRESELGKLLYEYDGEDIYEQIFYRDILDGFKEYGY